MHTSTLVLLIVIAFASALLPIGLVVLWAIFSRRAHHRRSPLTTEFHHLAGEYAGNQAEHLMEKANERLAIATLIGPLALAAWAFRRVDPHFLRFGLSEAILLVIIGVIAFLAARSGVKLLLTRRQYLDGLAAERATAQELAPLIAKGCAIYNDVPGEKFNLDHVVIGPAKVFMIETKSRQKPSGRGAANAQVKFDGNALIFPDWRDTRMLDQTRAEARWLSNYLYHKTGEPVRVEAVLALPGWYVTCTVATADVHVINPKLHDFMASSDGKCISEPQRRRIMTALEERYHVTNPSALPTENYS